MFSVLVTLVAIAVSMPLRSHVEYYDVSVVDAVFYFSLSSILLTSLVLAVVSKGLFNKLSWRLTALVISPVVALHAFLYLVLAISGERTAEATRYLDVYIIALSAHIALLSAIYLVIIGLLKRVLLLEQA